MRDNNSKFFILFYFILLSGCKAVSPPSFEEQSITYNRTMEQYKINQIFTNIIRAAEDRPLAFIDIPSVLGNANSSTTIGGTLGFSSGGTLWDSLGFSDLTAAGINPEQMYSEGFTFTQSSMDNATFWNVFMTRIPIQKLVYFRGDNYPEEMVFSLLIDEFYILKENGETISMSNDPTKPSYSEFKKLFDFLVERIEIVSDKSKSFPESSFGNYYSKVEDKVKGEDYVEVATICIKDKPTASSEYRFNADAYCHRDLEANLGKDKLIITLRSVKNIFEYLGQVAAAQLWDDPIHVELSNTIDGFKQTRMKNKIDKKNSTKLFVVSKDSDSIKSYAYTEDLHGNKFIIPANDSGYSKKVISFLSELLILTKIPGSSAPQPGVLLQ